jgi:hypothetical protein
VIDISLLPPLGLPLAAEGNELNAAVERAAVLAQPPEPEDGIDREQPCGCR